MTGSMTARPTRADADACGSSTPCHGLVLLDKPVGPSPFAAVRSLSQRFGAKAGHAGTLDPLASGLLLVIVGKATRLARYLVGLDKQYTAEIRLGVRTTTGDADGELLEQTEISDIERSVSALVGEVDLPIPAASAVKIDGERAYKLHRRGVAVDMPTRRSTISAAMIIARSGSSLRLDLSVSSGTYVRAVADHLGGHCTSLRRTHVGPFSVDDADENLVLSPADALPFLRAISVDGEAAMQFRSGRPVAGNGEGLVRVLEGGRLLGVARVEAGEAYPETVIVAR